MPSRLGPQGKALLSAELAAKHYGATAPLLSCLLGRPASQAGLLACRAGLVVHALHFDLFLLDLLWNEVLTLDL